MKLLQLVFVIALASGVAAILIYITGVSTLNQSLHVSDEDLEALHLLQNDFQQCVRSNGFGLQAVSRNELCEVEIQYPRDTIPKWKNPKAGELEG